MRGLILSNHTRPDYFGFGQMDITINASGHPTFASGRERVRHDVLKGILTGKAGDYGTALPGIVGEKNVEFLHAMATLTVDEFVRRYKEAQSTSLPDEERIASVKSLEIVTTPDQRTRMLVQLAITMLDSRTVLVENAFPFGG